jgi:SAM-dependent methyltransferase
MLRLLKKIIPEKIKIKRQNIKEAQHLATSIKHLDICASQVAHMLHLSGRPSIEGKVCVEVGSGWVLSHALIFHLLGAQKVIATDIAPLAYPQFLFDSVHRAELSLVRDILAPFSEHSLVRKRLEALSALPLFSFDTLKSLGIEYRAPIDFSVSGLDVPYDVIYSFSVLEHVYNEKIPALLNNLAINLQPNGVMLHAIHLEDHKDFINHPFAFLSEPALKFTEYMQNERGNRIRSGQWMELLDDIKGLKWQFIYKWDRKDRELPNKIDCSIRNAGVEDLRVSHLGIFGKKSV